MTLDEAIKHCQEVYAEQKCSKTARYNGNACAEQHKQLAEWLKDYKRLLELKNDYINRNHLIETFTDMANHEQLLTWSYRQEDLLCQLIGTIIKEPSSLIEENKHG